MDVNRTALPDISLRGLTKRFGEVVAVDRVSITSPARASS